jgi:hypothetical protein
VYNNSLVLFLFIVIVSLPGFGWTQNETPANVPQEQPTMVPAPENLPPQEPQVTPTPRPVRQRTPVSVDNEPEEKPLYMNVAVYVGGGCFLVVFIGLYMILSSTPSSRSKRRRKKE